MLDRIFGRRRREFRLLLTDAASRRLNAHDEARLDALIASSAELRVEYEETMALAGLLRAQPLVSAPRSFTLAGVPAPAAPRSPAPRLRALQAMTAVAAIALVALIATDLAVVDSPSGVSNLTLPPSAESLAAPEAASGEDAEARSFSAPSAAPEPAPLVAAQALPDESGGVGDRGALGWAVVAVGLVTAALALGAVTTSVCAARRSWP